MQYYYKRFFVLHSSEAIFSFLIKKSKQKAIEIVISFFHCLGNPRVAHWIISFMLHTYPSYLPQQTDTYIDELVEIFLTLSMKIVQVHLIIWTTLVASNRERISFMLPSIFDRTKLEPAGYVAAYHVLLFIPSQ